MTAAPQTAGEVAEQGEGRAAAPAPFVVIGLDLSLTGAGIASSRGWVATVGSTGKADATLFQRRVRLDRQSALVMGHVSIDADLAVVEGPSYASSGAGTWDRAGLWWLVVDRLHARRIPVVLVSPDQRACYATGIYKAGKDQVLAAVVRRYLDIEVSNNNEADALVLAAMGARALGHPIDDLPATHLRAMAKVAWPEPVSA